MVAFRFYTYSYLISSLEHAFKNKKIFYFAVASSKITQNKKLFQSSFNQLSTHWHWKSFQRKKLICYFHSLNIDNTNSYQQHGANATGRRLRKVRNVNSTQPSRFRAKKESDNPENMTSDSISPSKGIDKAFICWSPCKIIDYRNTTSSV